MAVLKAKKGSASFLKKEAKNFLLLRALAIACHSPQLVEVFLLLFFQKKKPLLTFTFPNNAQLRDHPFPFRRREVAEQALFVRQCRLHRLSVGRLAGAGQAQGLGATVDGFAL